MRRTGYLDLAAGPGAAAAEVFPASRCRTCGVVHPGGPIGVPARQDGTSAAEFAALCFEAGWPHAANSVFIGSSTKIEN